MKELLTSKIFRTIAAVIWLCVITFLCLVPGEKLPHKGVFKIPNLDKAVHFIMFGILSLLLVWRYGKNDFRGILLILAISVSYGGLIEIIQSSWAVNRSGSWSDWMFDIVGSIMGWLVFCGIQHIFNHRIRHKISMH